MISKISRSNQMSSRASSLSVDRIIALCREKGLRMTSKRIAVATALYESEDHPDVESLWRRARRIDPKVSQATVYRTLRLFEEAGALDRHKFSDEPARFEAHPESHHDHLIDVDTGDIIDFHDKDIEVLQNEIARRLGFELVDHSLILRGKRITRDK